MQSPCFLDYAATTPVDPRVAQIMSDYLTLDGVFGNASSTHVYGFAAKDAIEHARHEVAELIQAEASEIIWTSGATEANNLALKGITQLYQKKGNHIITVKTEHASVLDCCQVLEKQGMTVTYLTPDKNGLISLEKLEKAIRKETVLISVMHINNETGVIQDIESVGEFASKHHILFHVDAAQSAGKIFIDVNQQHIDLLSMSAHKFYGPKGMGALYLRKRPRVRVAAQLHGGGHESGMRSGTLPTHQIVGMGMAASLAKQEMQQDENKLFALREKLFTQLKNISNITSNVESQYCFPGIINLQIAGMTAHEFMKFHPEIAISAGSACSAKGNEPSYVLRAMGFSREEAASSIRISMGRFTTESEVERLVYYLSKPTMGITKPS